MSALTDYIAAWRDNNADRIVAAVTPDVVVTECFGPIYFGQDRVREWADTWFAKGNYVRSWVVTSELETGDRQVAEWRFDYHLGGRDQSFEGASIATARDGKIATLREYATTAALYPWEGKWR